MSMSIRPMTKGFASNGVRAIIFEGGLAWHAHPGGRITAHYSAPIRNDMFIEASFSAPAPQPSHFEMFWDSIETLSWDYRARSEGDQ